MRNIRNKFQNIICRSLAAVVGVLMLAGCASTLDARITSYQQWPSGTEGATYTIVADDAQRNNLEFQAYADMVRANISATGLVEAQQPTLARFDVHLSYSSPVSQTWVQRYNDNYINDGWGFSPFFGGYGGGYSGWGGGFYMGPSVVNVPVEIHKNTLVVIINDKHNQGAEVYRSSAVSISQDNNLAELMPYLARAVFDGFPGNNGQVREVRYERQR
ncbi:MAG: DUF4136 domain-containing protein [Burkholderiaceae bacterium]|nr:DUF4136 domain-containing protein [Burkholderiaceae bacterium]